MKRLLFIIVALSIVSACGDKGDGERFDPETDWVTIAVNNPLEINSQLTMLYDKYLKKDCPEGDICPTDIGGGPFFRNVIMTGGMTEFIFGDLGGPLYGGIYNLDMSQTVIEKMGFMTIPAEAKVVALPETLIEMGAAFMGCGELMTMVIPGNVESLHDYNFSGLDKLTSVVVNAATPPEVLYAMDLNPGQEAKYPKIYPAESWKLTLPAGSKAAYEAHEWWGRFTNIVEK